MRPHWLPALPSLPNTPPLSPEEELSKIASASPRRQRVIVIGGGFGGVAAARELEPLAQLVDVTLVDTKDYFENTSAIWKTFTNPMGKTLPC